MIPCPHCGIQVRESAKFCPGCGKAITPSHAAQAAPSAPPTAVSHPPSRRFCPQCGKSITLTAKFCPHCCARLTSFIGGSAPLPGAGLGVPNAAGKEAESTTGKIPANTLVAGRYRVVNTLGEGGMGAVYLAVDIRLNDHLIALKEMSDSYLRDPQERQKAIAAFQREAQLLSALCHPNLPRVTDFFAEHGQQFLAMDYISGETLERKMESRSQPFTESEVLEWARQLCDVLGYMHSRTPPIIFRDLKPGNIMIMADNQVKLIDFGIVRLFKEGAQKDTTLLGTPGYAPPEQYGKAQTDARSDIYALGALLHHLLTLRDPGCEPFKFPTVRSLNSNVSFHVEDAIMHALKLPADQRWSNAQEFWSALSGKPDGKKHTAGTPAFPLPLSAPPGLSATLIPVSPQFTPSYASPADAFPLPVSSQVNLAAPASLGSRFGAYMLDNLITSVVVFILAMIASAMNPYNPGDAAVLYLSLSGVWLLSYYTISHATNGQTLGKRASKIKVVRRDGSPLGWGLAVWRTVVFLAPTVLTMLVFGNIPVGSLLYLWPLFHPERRAFHDLLAGTWVITT